MRHWGRSRVPAVRHPDQHRFCGRLWPRRTGTEPQGPDEEPTAAVADRLFETLDTTTRRATLRGRPVLLTDTVGFVSDLPHWLVESFGETLSEAAAADAVVLVADASDPPDAFREKLRVSLDVLDAQGVDRDSVVTALNKIDLLSAGERERRLEAAADLAPAPVPVSVTEGTNLDDLVGGVRERLPTERVELTMPAGDESMSVVSWLYDNATVEEIEYGTEGVRVAVSGRPGVVERARARADAVGDPA